MNFTQVCRNYLMELKRLPPDFNLTSFDWCMPRIGRPPVTQTHVDNFKNIVCELFWGNCEPEWETKCAWLKWESLNADNLEWVVLSSGDGWAQIGSGYQDPSIPVLQHKERLWEAKL